MCFDTEIFKAKVDENLFCPICKLVLCIDSLQVILISVAFFLLTNKCLQSDKDEYGHCFCRTCIRTWTYGSRTCPINRDKISYEILRPIPLAFSGILSK